MNIVDPQAQAYADQYTSEPRSHLQTIAQATRDHSHGHMSVGKTQGKFLEFISRLLHPRRVLEIGTFQGYSALCLAEGLAPDGLLHTIECRMADAQAARENFLRSSARDKIILHLGKALDVLENLRHETWDLVFLDADKTGYVQYYQTLVPRIRPGGFLLADNVLFHGEVCEKVPQGKNAKAIQEFNDLVKSDQKVEQVLLTVRDGLLMIRKT